MHIVHELGRVALLQVAPVVPKVWEATYERYDPAPLRTVTYALLNERGIVGVLPNGEQIMDVHHIDHPQSRFRGANAVSVGFTGHYAVLRDRFGAHLVDGCAAENILIEATDRVVLDEPDLFVVLEQAATGRRYVLGRAAVAEPCMPFARWVVGAAAAPEQIRTTLQQLRHGMRGFYLDVPPTTEQIRIDVGDRLLVAGAPPNSTPG